MSRNRSWSLPPVINTPGVPLSVHLRQGPFMESPLAIARSISANPDTPATPLLNRIESNAELGPMRKRRMSDPTSAVRVSTNASVGEVEGSRDEDASWSGETSIEDVWDTAWTKDAVRRYHALKELLSTEYDYLEDLRFLVTVYLRNLPALGVKSLYYTFASFTTGPSSSWMHSSTSHVSSITGQPAEPQVVSAPSTSSHSKGPSSRLLFTDHEVELLTRNGEEILQFHEHFFKELCILLEPLGFSFQWDESERLGAPHIAESLQLANVDEAITIVSTKFSAEASRFNIYQTFCAGHPEAMDVLRKALQQFPVELDIFEHRSSSIVFEILESKNKPVLPEVSSSTQKLSHNTIDAGSKSLSVDAIMPPALEDRKRTLSLTSLDDRKVSKLKSSSSPKSLKLRASMTAMPAISIASSNKEDVALFPDVGTSSELQRLATTSSGGTNGSEPTKFKERDKSSFSTRKIAMADYLIKPVQRICKYPLLLDQLLPSKSLRVNSRKVVPNARAGVDVVVRSAAQAMRHVAASVDAARERQSIATQSSLVFSRICLGLQVQGVLSSGSFPYSSHSGSPPHHKVSASRDSTSTHTQLSSQIRLLSPTFLSSLGPCLLSGSLDVIHYSHPVNGWLTGAIKGKVKMKAKYLGAFLYNGGYLIFVKVGKGKRYEPRHWFALDGWDTVSIDDEEAMLPHSFRLSKAGQHFELAASCVREKDVWLASIVEAVKHVPVWIAEPVPSFVSDGSKGIAESAPPSAPASDDGHGEPVEPVEEGLTESSGDVGGLPTICSIPDVCETNGPALESEPKSTPFLTSLRGHVHERSGRKKGLSTLSGGGSKRHPQSQLDEDAPSRRSSSSTSVMSIFAPIHVAPLDRERERYREKETETVLISRSSVTTRQAIDFGLQDVISSSCASARAEATWREKVDVGPGTVRGSTKAKTNSSTAMSGVSRGMTILSKHESVRVPRKKTSVTVETLSRSSASTKGTSRRKKLSLSSFSFKEHKSTTSLPIPTTTSSDLSWPQNSSSHSVVEDICTTPISATFISIPPGIPSKTKKSRSFVRNVKDLFQFRHAITSPVSVIVSHPTQTSLQSVAYMDALQQENQVSTNANYPAHGLLKRFTKDSGRTHGEDATEGEEIDYVTITSIHEADEDVAKEKFSITVPLLAAPMRII